MEDDDDDIYAVDDMSNYDMTMGGEEQDANFGWTGPRKRGIAAASYPSSLRFGTTFTII